MAVRVIVTGLAALLAAAGLAACTSEPAQERAPVIAPGLPGEPASTIPPDEVSAAPNTPPNAADIAYVRDMIVHHRQALDMAGLAPERAAADALKRLADRISGVQGAEIDMMNAWLRTHGQPTVDPAHPEHAGIADHAGMPGMATPAQLDALRAARGADFDRLFVELMVAHHQGALTMSHEILNKGADVRVQEIADDVIATQSDEIRNLRAMLGAE